MVLDRGGAGKVEGQSGFSHGRTGGDDDHLAGHEPVGELVKVGEPSRNAGHGVAASLNGLKLVKGTLE